MPAFHEYYSLGRGKHILPTDWTIAIRGSLNAFMAVLHLDGDASLTDLWRLALGVSLENALTEPYLAMIEIFTKPFANPTDAAVIAMIDAFLGIVVP